MSHLYTVQEGIALVTLSNPPVNALSWALRQHVVAAIMRWLGAQGRQDQAPQPDAASRQGQHSLF